MIELHRKNVEAILLLESERQPKTSKFAKFTSSSGLTLESHIDVKKTLWCTQGGDFRDFYNLLIATPSPIPFLKVITFYSPYTNKPTEVVIDDQKFMI